MKDRIAFLFPGQGSQLVGMDIGLSKIPEVNLLYEEATQVLGYDTRTLSQEQLNDTLFTQPALFINECAHLLALDLKGIQPDFVAGHSLGMYAAYVASGVLSFATGLRCVEKRAQVMRQAGLQTPGKMVALAGTSIENVRTVIKRHNLDISNHNSPTQVVVSGSETQIEQAFPDLKHISKLARILDVSIAGHSRLMNPAADAYHQFLHDKEISTPQIPIIVDSRGHQVSDPRMLRIEMAKQLTETVLWVYCMNTLVDLGTTQFVECGPKDVLTKLAIRDFKIPNVTTAKQVLENQDSPS